MTRTLPAALLALLLMSAMSAAVCSKSPAAPTQPPVATTGPSTGGAPPVQALPETLVGAGDIAVCGSPGSEETARLLDGMPGTIFTAGDHAYMSGSDREFQECYGPTWGRHRHRTRPSPGNHEYESPGAAPYFGYFGLQAGPPGLGYYAYRLGAWEVFSLNSTVDTSEASAQYQWLAAELARRPARCSLAYWHHPVVNEGPHGDSRHMLPIWRLLHQHGVDVVLAGHDHNYQRFAALDGDLRRDPLRGTRQFIVGTGGATVYAFTGGSQLVEARGGAWGVLKLTFAAESYTWEFVSVPGQAFHDAGQDVCHA